MADEQRITPVSWSEVERWQKLGYEVFREGDAGKAVGEGFVIMHKKQKERGSDFRILCPTFLRGSLGFTDVNGSVSY